MHGPYEQAIRMGAIFDSRKYGPCVRLSKIAPVGLYAARFYCAYDRIVRTGFSAVSCTMGRDKIRI